jgi:DNA-binding transcriptional regulator YiaG
MMKKIELTEFRQGRAMRQADFGAWLSAQLERQRAYTVSEVSNWETGQRDIPFAVQAVIFRTQRDEALEGKG